MISSPIMTTSLSAEEITPEVVQSYIKRHKDNETARLQRLSDYYSGEHDILSRPKDEGLSNNRIVTNYAKYIANFASAYLLGEPVTYTPSDGADISALSDALKIADSATQDVDLALDAAIFGRAYDMMYMSADEKPVPKLARLSPLNTFVVYDDTVEQKPVFGVYYYPIYTATGSVEKYTGSYCTDKLIVKIELSSEQTGIKKLAETGHFFGVVPIDEIYNNGQREGDFEGVLPLINAYNTLLSDRVNDKEQFVDSFLLIKGGVSLGDYEEERSELYEEMKTHKVLELPEGGDASFLTRQFDEAAVDILQRDIVTNIHKISGVPDMSDESFAGNSSGVAMKYKLLGLEQITKTKERYFTEGLRYRLRGFANVIAAKGGAAIDVSEITIQFKRSLPVNEQEIAQTVSLLNGIIPLETLLSMIPAVKNPEEAAKTIKKEQKEELKRQKEMYFNMALVNPNNEE